MSGKPVTVVLVVARPVLMLVREQTTLRAEAYERRAIQAHAASNLLEHDRLKLQADWLRTVANQLIPLNPKAEPDLYRAFMRHAEIHIER